MLKKLKELFGFPTEAEKVAAKTETEQPKLFVDGHGDVREVQNAQTFAFPKGDKPEAEIKAPTKKPRVVKPKAEKAPVEKTPAAKKPAAKKPAAKKPVARKAKASVVGSGDVKQN